MSKLQKARAALAVALLAGHLGVGVGHATAATGATATATTTARTTTTTTPTGKTFTLLHKTFCVGEVAAGEKCDFRLPLGPQVASEASQTGFFDRLLAWSRAKKPTPAFELSTAIEGLRRMLETSTATSPSQEPHRSRPHGG